MEIVGFEHLHLHTTEGSLLDGYGKSEEYAARAIKINQKFLCVTDHGMMSVIPRQIAACDAKNLFPVFGCELYCNPMQPEVKFGQQMSDFTKDLDSDERKKLRKNYHILAIAYNEVGYKNLVKLTSWGWLHGFYGKPRVNHEQLMLHKEGIIFTSGCYNSEIAQSFAGFYCEGGDECGFRMVEKYMAMFGENFYLELQLLDFAKQQPYDAFLIRAHNKYKVPLVVTNDVHYCDKEDSKMQRYMLMIQTGKTINDIQQAIAENEMADLFELQDQNLWMKSEEEMNQKWESDYSQTIDYDLFKMAKANTVTIMEKAKGVELDRSIKLPQIPDAEVKLRELSLQGFSKRQLPRTKIYQNRFEEEYELICQKGFASYFLIQKMMTDEARRICPQLLGFGNGAEAVGPGRGCLSLDTPVPTQKGVKSLSDVCPGDLVVTRDGTFKEVLKVFDYEISEDLLCVKCYYGDAVGVKLTKDHLVLVEKGRRPNRYDGWSTATKHARKRWEEPNGTMSWVRADALEVGDWVFVPKIIFDKTFNESIDLVEYGDETLTYDKKYVFHNIINPLTKRINRTKRSHRYLLADLDLYYFLGRFVGGGWLRKKDKTYVGFAFHSNDAEGIAKIVNIAKKWGFDDFRIRRHKTKRVTQLFIKNRCLYNWISNIHNRYIRTADSKHVPSFVFTSNEESIFAYLRGYCDSDGHHEKHKSKFTSVSKSLLEQVRMLCWSIGLPASLLCDKRIGDKRKEFRNSKLSYCVNIPKSCKVGDVNAEKKYCYKSLQNGILLKIRSIDAVGGIKTVRDLQVADNENYLTTSFLVHNSAVGSLICYCLGVTDVNPIEHDLLFSRFLSPARGGKSMKLRFSKEPINKHLLLVDNSCPFDVDAVDKGFSGPAERPMDIS
jgi:intein/homing endonuclease